MRSKIFMKAVVFVMTVTLLFGVCACAKPQSEAEVINPEISAQTLAESSFNADAAKKEYVNPEAGLKNPYTVGINKNDYENQVLYPAPADADSVVINPCDAAYGMTGNDIEDDTIAMQKALNAAKAKRAAGETKPIKIKLPAGKVYFYEGFYDPQLDIAQDPSLENMDIVGQKYGISVYNISNLSIEGTVENGELKTEIVFVGELGFRGMKIVNCDEFYLYNVQIDWGNLPFYTGNVVEIAKDRRSVVVETLKDFPMHSDIEIVEYQEYNNETKAPRMKGNFLHNHNEVRQIPKTEYISEHKVRLTFASPLSPLEEGTLVSISEKMHFSETIMVEKCKNPHFETVYVYCAPGMAFKSYSNDNIYINRYMPTLKPGTNRLQVGTSDLLHIKNTKGEVKITNSQFEYSYDDGINVGGHFTRPYDKNVEANSVTVRWPGGMWGTFIPEAGDILELMDTNSMATIAHYKVKDVTYKQDNGDGYTVTFDTAGGKETVCGEEVTLETDISKIRDANTQAFANLTRTPQLTIRNCMVRNKRNRGMLIQTRNVLIENCAFSNVIHCALSLLSEVTTFNESTPPKNVVVRNCKFLNNDGYDIGATAYGNQLSAGSPDAMQNIKIENNFFAYTRSTPAIYLQGCSKIDLTGNWIYKPCTDQKTSDANKVAVKLYNVKEMNISKNLVEKFRPAYKTITAIGACDLGTIVLAEDNVGFNRTELFGELKDIKVAKTDAKITVDGNIGEWKDVTASDINMDYCTDIHVGPVGVKTIKKEDFSATTKIAYTNEGIYLMFDVVDESVQFQQGAWWLGDGLELFLTTSNSFSVIDTVAGDDNEDCLQYFVKPNAKGDAMASVVFDGRTTKRIVENQNQILSELRVKEDGKGYVGEVFLPFSVLTVTKAKIDAGEKIAISVSFGDSDADSAGKYNDLFMTFSNAPHPTTTNKMVPGMMPKFIFE